MTAITLLLASLAFSIVVGRFLRTSFHQAEECRRELEAERFGVFHAPENFETFVHGSALDAAAHK